MGLTILLLLGACAAEEVTTPTVDATSLAPPTTTGSPTPRESDTDPLTVGDLEALLPTPAQLEAAGLGPGWEPEPARVVPSTGPDPEDGICGIRSHGSPEWIEVIFRHPDSRGLILMLYPSIPQVAIIETLRTCEESGLSPTNKMVLGANTSVVTTSEQWGITVIASFDRFDLHAAFAWVDPESPSEPPVQSNTEAEIDAVVAIAEQVGASAS